MLLRKQRNSSGLDTQSRTPVKATEDARPIAHQTLHLSDEYRWLRNAIRNQHQNQASVYR
jgi:hypothetical protein